MSGSHHCRSHYNQLLVVVKRTVFFPEFRLPHILCSVIDRYGVVTPGSLPQARSNATGISGPSIGILMEQFDRILFEVFSGIPRALALKEGWRRKVPH